MVATKKPGNPFYDPADFPFCKILEDNYEVIRKEWEALLKTKLVRARLVCSYSLWYRLLGQNAICASADGMCLAFTRSTIRLNKIAPFAHKRRKSWNKFQAWSRQCFLALRQNHTSNHTCVNFLYLYVIDNCQVGYYQYSEKILRAHLGIVVPDGCALRANQELTGWEEGKCMIFDVRTSLLCECNVVPGHLHARSVEQK